jgi:aminodeoxyfutalosine synthase
MGPMKSALAESFDPVLSGVVDRCRSGGRLDFEDGMRLFESRDLVTVGLLANEVCQRLHGNTAYFNINRHLNPTNVCIYSCTFCAFARKEGEEGAYTYSLDEVRRAAAAMSGRVTEVHVVGGLHHGLPYEFYLDVLRAVKRERPDVHLKAYTAVELDFLSGISKKPLDAVLDDLTEAGLGSIPGGGAEIFHPEVRSRICDYKLDWNEWAAVHRAVHARGMKSNCTMLFGHIENYEHRVDHLLKLRSLQDETGGFNAFIPLAFHPEHTPLARRMGLDRLSGPTGWDCLKTVAVSRLLLDNVPHVKAYWVMLGLKTAQVALHFGADDLDGTVTEEKIVHMAGARSPQEVGVPDLVKMIKDAGRTPVERDTLYRPLRTYSQKESLP